MADLISETAQLDPEAEAQRLVGKFLQSFAVMEQALDKGIGKLLGLEAGINDIVCSGIPFAKKVEVFFSAEGLHGSMPDQERKKLLHDTRSGILTLNDEERVMFAHNPFSADDQGGLSFRRVVVKKMKFKVSTVQRSSTDVETNCREAERFSSQLEQLVLEMKPYKPSLEFNDTRNSGFLALI